MRTIGVIPSRWGSTRFPGKSLALICGRPLVVWVVEAVQRAQALDDVCVATDDERIAAAVAPTGARVAMTRSDHPSGTDRVAEAAAAADGDIVINIQGDEPMMDAALIDRLAGVMQQDPDWDMATASAPLTRRADLESPSVVKVVTDVSQRALYFSRLPIPYRRDGEAELDQGLYWRHLGIYAYRGAFLNRLVREPPCALEQYECLEQLRALHLGGRMAVVRTDAVGVGVDTPEDVPYVESLMRDQEFHV